MLYSKLLIIGDSLSNLSRDTSSWAFELCKIALKESYVIFPIVYAFSGYTSFQLLKEAPPILERYRGDIKELVIQFGTNDAKDEIQTNVCDFRDNLNLIKAWAFGYRLYFLTIPIPKGFGTDGYTSAIKHRVNQYNELIREVFGDRCIDINTQKFVDGIHYSREGNIEVARAVWEKIKNERSF